MPQKNDDLLRELIDKYTKLYMKIANRRGIPYDDVEDVVMDTFTSFYKSERYEELRGRTEEANFVMVRAVINKCNDYHRKYDHEEYIDYEEWKAETEQSEPSADADPERIMVNHEKAWYVRQCIMEMKETWKEPAWLYFVEEKSIREICERLEITEDVCRSRISRARKYLRKELNDMEEDI